MFEDASGVEDGSIGDFRRGRRVAEVEMSAGATAGFGFTAVAGVAVNFESHVAAVKVSNSVRVHGAIVKKLVDFAARVLCSVALFRGEGTEGDIHGTIDGTGAVEEGADDLLYQKRGVVSRGSASWTERP